jgi:hypothetical protein
MNLSPRIFRRLSRCQRSDDHGSLVLRVDPGVMLKREWECVVFESLEGELVVQ